MGIMTKLKTVFFTLMLMTVIGLGINAAAAPIDTIEFKEDTQILTVSGTVYRDGTKYINDVTLQVFQYGKGAEDLQTVTAGNMKSVLQYVGQTKVDKTGFYQFRYKVNTELGKHTLRVLLSRDSKAYTGSFVYITSTTASSVANAARGANTPEKMRANVIDVYDNLFKDYSEIYGQLLEADPTKAFLTPVCTAMAKNPDAYVNLEDVINAFKREIFVQKINRTQGGGAVFALIDSNSSQLGIQNNAIYKDVFINHLEADARQKVFEAMDSLTYPDSDALIKDMYEKIITSAVNNAKNWSEIRPILDKVRTFLAGFDLSAYDSLDTTTGKPKVDKALVDSTFENLEELKVFFNKKAVDVKIELGQKGSDSSGGGGGGKGGSKAATQFTMPSIPVLPDTPVLPQRNEPEDLEPVLWAVESIHALIDANVINVNADKKFYPNNTITREEYLKMVVAAFGLLDEGATTDFKDLEPGQWYNAYIASAQKNGLANGGGDGLFGIGKPITREDMAVLAYRAMKIKYGKEMDSASQEIRFQDEENISEYAGPCVYAMKNAGIINGKSDGRFAPKEPSTRAEAAKIIYGLLEYIKK